MPNSSTSRVKAVFRLISKGGSCQASAFGVSGLHLILRKPEIRIPHSFREKIGLILIREGPLNSFPVKYSLTPLFALFFALVASQIAFAQTAPEQTPQPGQLGSPFPVEHAWNHFGLEVAGGYAPVLQKGAGFFNQGFSVTTGVVDHFSPRLSAMVEAQIFRLRGSQTSSNGSVNSSNVVVCFGAAASYSLMPRSATSPYLIGGGGYYYIGPLAQSGPAGSDPTAVNSVNAAGFSGGAGLRHRLYADRSMEIFAEGRYHFIASGSTAFGQLSLLPVTAGIRW